MMASHSYAVAPSPSNLVTAPKANSENEGEAGLKEPVKGDVGTVGGDEGLLDSASTVESTGDSEANGSTTKSSSSPAAETPIPESTTTTSGSAAVDVEGSISSSPSSEPSPAPSEPSPAPSEPSISMGSGFSE